MDEETLTVWLDTALLILGGFVLLAIMMLAAVNPKAEAKTEGEQSPGNVIIEAHWPSGIDADVDLWVKAPGERPVGYSHLADRYFNLLRDDLGKDLNYEVAYSRGLPAGEYIANVHLYRSGSGIAYPLKVEVAARLKATPQEIARQIASATVELLHEGDEITAFRFTLDGNGGVVPGSLNHLQHELRAAE